MNKYLTNEQWETVKTLSARKENISTKVPTPVDAFFTSFFVSLTIILYFGAWLKIYGVF